MKRQVVVVGAGPTGSTAAFYLAKAGLDVLLVDQEVWPRDKVCGDAYMPGLFPIFEEMGIMEEMEREVACEVNSLRIYDPEGERTDYTAPPFILVPRRIGDDIIRRGAINGGVDFLDNFCVTSLIREGNRITGINANHNNVDVSIEADVVIIANGSHSLLAREVGVFAEDNPKMWMYAARGYFNNVENMVPGQAVQIYIPSSLPNYVHCANYIWVTPLYEGNTGGKVASVGCVINEYALRELNMTHDEVFEYWINETESGQYYMKNATVAKPMVGCRLPSCSTLTQVAFPGAVVLGDAANMPDKASQYGIDPGMYAAQELASILPDYIKAKDYTQAAVDAVQGALEARLNPTYAFNTIYMDQIMDNPDHLKRFFEYSRKQEVYPAGYAECIFGFLTEELGIPLG